MLEGTASGLLALRAPARRCATWRAPAGADAARCRVADEVRDRWRDRLAAGGPIGELEGLALLADYGVPVVAGARRRDADEAVRGGEPRSGSRSR